MKPRAPAEEPTENQHSNQQLGMPVDRRGAAVVISLPPTGDFLDRQLAQALLGRLPAIARDPGIYAVILKIGLEPPGATVASAPSGRAGRHGRDLVWLLDCFSKPIVAVADGPICPVATDLQLLATHKVACDRFTFAVASAARGVPLSGATAHVLARLPGAFGPYLALTGRRIGRADAHALGLITHCMSAANFEACVPSLADAEPMDPVLDACHRRPGDGELPPLAGLIADTFSAQTVEEIVTRLERIRDGDGRVSAFAADALSALAAASPLALKIVHRQIRLAAAMDLRQTLAIEHRLACRLETQTPSSDEKHPTWRPARLEDVTTAMIDRLLTPLGSEELILPTRQEMQAARV